MIPYSIRIALREISYNGLDTGKLQVYERAGISLVKVNERGKICHLGLQKGSGPKGLTGAFYGCQNFKDSAFIIKRCKVLS